MSKTQGRIDALANTLQDWLREKMGVDAPLPEEISKVIRDHFTKFGVTLSPVEEQVGEEKRVAAILKPTLSANSKRMRELAGIPGKGNFV
jgi:antitoxin component HigA of HigAB toxin-antitoxin module